MELRPDDRRSLEYLSAAFCRRQGLPNGCEVSILNRVGRKVRTDRKLLRKGPFRTLKRASDDVSVRQLLEQHFTPNVDSKLLETGAWEPILLSPEGRRLNGNTKVGSVRALPGRLFPQPDLKERRKEWLRLRHVVKAHLEELDEVRERPAEVLPTAVVSALISCYDRATVERALATLDSVGQPRP
jgi:hypothetical protein